jgi:hypothetical protein
MIKKPHVKHMDVFIRTPVWFVDIAGNEGKNSPCKSQRSKRSPAAQLRSSRYRRTKGRIQKEPAVISEARQVPRGPSQPRLVDDAERQSDAARCARVLSQADGGDHQGSEFAGWYNTKMERRLPVSRALSAVAEVIPELTVL